MVGSPDLVSVEAAAAGLVQRDAGGNAVQGVMPAYLTREHFERWGGGWGGRRRREGWGVEA